jgi:cysteinyl-tRNA synthetase
MSQKFLGVDTLDIHAGGRDLIFPHHENEIAQAQALTGKPFARYWIHHGLLTINNQKMSKSLGNFVTIRDFILKYGSPDLLKLFFLSAHYSHPVDYSEAKIEEARQARERIMIFMDKAEAVKPCFCLSFKRIKELKAIENRFIASMDDDFNTPGALACVFELVSLGNKNMDKGAFVLEAKRLLSGFLKILNIDLKKPSLRGIVEEAHIAGKIKERNDARKSKDYALSDRIRRELEEQGIVLEDAKDGTTSWRRKV